MGTGGGKREEEGEKKGNWREVREKGESKREEKGMNKEEKQNCEG